LIFIPQQFKITVSSVIFTCSTAKSRVARWQTKNNNFGIFWRALEWKMLGVFLVLWHILWLLGTYIYASLVFLYVVIWYIFYHFGKLYQEKSGNPGEKNSVALFASERHSRSFLSTGCNSPRKISASFFKKREPFQLNPSLPKM
jgi:hypothetical protein